MQPAPSQNSKLTWQVRAFALALLTVGLMTQFNNCGNYAEPALVEANMASVSCDTPKCISPKATALNIAPHVGSAGEYGVPPALSEFNLGGDCNEGGYPANTVRWELWLNGVVVRHSGMQITSGGNANSRCEQNGHEYGNIEGPRAGGGGDWGRIT